MEIKEKSLLSLFFVMLLCFGGITGIVSAASEEGLHSLPPIPSEAVPQWEREYVPGNGDPVVEVINEGMPKALFSLYYTENSADFDDDFYLNPADYSVTVSKGETQIIVAEAGEYYYYSTEAEESDSASWSASANIWLDEDCIYKAVFPNRGYSDKSTEEPTDEIETEATVMKTPKVEITDEGLAEYIPVGTTSVTPSTPGFIGVTAIIALIATIVLFERKRE